MLIDTHCHLCDSRLAEQVSSVISRASAAGVDYLCDVGYDEKTIKCVIKHIETYENVYGIIGIHPHDSKNYTPEIEKYIHDLFVSQSKLIGLGEIGLDYHHNFSPPDIQRRVFEKQLQLARRLDVPIIIHTRESMADTLEILRKNGPYPARGIFHCFSGNVEQAREVIEQGFLISIAGPVTYKNNKQLREVVREIPIEYIVVETDSPYLPPSKKRGELNEPANVNFVVEKIAEIKLMTVEDVRRITSYNAKQLFSYRLPSVFPSLRPNQSRIVYFIGNKMYLNITNRCTNRCVFCIRNTTDFINNHYLRLVKEPSAEEVIKELAKYDLKNYEEVVFCGFGEPTIRLDVLVKVAKYMKKHGARWIRLDTNGTANLYHRRNVISELAKYIDEVSVSLNAHNNEVYMKLCKPVFGELTYEAVKEFIRLSVGNFKKVVATALDLPEVDRDACRRIAEGLGAVYRQRYYSPAG